MNETPRAEIHPPHTNVPKSFLAYLAEQQNGDVVAELSEELRGLIEAIETHYEKFRGKVSGELKLALRLTLEKGVYRVRTTYETRRPRAPEGETVMWLGPGGSLQTNNPKQLQMPFRPVAG